LVCVLFFFFFFFQAEDGIRDRTVTGVKTCALPISPNALASAYAPPPAPARTAATSITVPKRRPSRGVSRSGISHVPSMGSRCGSPQPTSRTHEDAVRLLEHPAGEGDLVSRAFEDPGL